MDLNLVVLRGRLAAPPDLRVFDSGTRMLRMLVTVRTEMPRTRIDVIPVNLWDPPDHLLDPGLEVSGRIWAAGTVQRRCSDGPEGRWSRLEVTAHAVSGLDLMDSCGVSPHE